MHILCTFVTFGHFGRFFSKLVKNDQKWSKKSLFFSFFCSKKIKKMFKNLSNFRLFFFSFVWDLLWILRSIFWIKNIQNYFIFFKFFFLRTTAQNRFFYEYKKNPIFTINSRIETIFLGPKIALFCVIFSRVYFLVFFYQKYFIFYVGEVGIKIMDPFCLKIYIFKYIYKWMPIKYIFLRPLFLR